MSKALVIIDLIEEIIGKMAYLIQVINRLAHVKSLRKPIKQRNMQETIISLLFG